MTAHTTTAPRRPLDPDGLLTPEDYETVERSVPHRQLVLILDLIDLAVRLAGEWDREHYTDCPCPVCRLGKNEHVDHIHAALYAFAWNGESAVAVVDGLIPPREFGPLDGVEAELVRLAGRRWPVGKTKADSRVPPPTAGGEADDLAEVVRLLKRSFPRVTDTAVVIIPGDGLPCIAVTILGDCPASIPLGGTGTYTRCSGCTCRC